MKKILVVATVVKTHIMQFHIPVFKMLKEKGWNITVAAKNDYETDTDCNKMDFCVWKVIPTTHRTGACYYKG